MYMSKEDALFLRDETGELLQIDLELKSLRKKTFETINGEKILKETPGPIIKIKPICRGEWLKILRISGEEQDKKILLEYIKEPKFEEKDLKALKPSMVGAIITAITEYTLNIEDSDYKNKNILTEAEEFELQKNSKREDFV